MSAENNRAPALQQRHRAGRRGVDGRLWKRRSGAAPAFELGLETGVQALRRDRVIECLVVLRRDVPPLARPRRPEEVAAASPFVEMSSRRGFVGVLHRAEGCRSQDRGSGIVVEVDAEKAGKARRLPVEVGGRIGIVQRQDVLPEPEAPSRLPRADPRGGLRSSNRRSDRAFDGGNDRPGREQPVVAPASRSGLSTICSAGDDVAGAAGRHAWSRQGSPGSADRSWADRNRGRCTWAGRCRSDRSREPSFASM